MEPGNVHKENAQRIKKFRKPRKMSHRCETLPANLLDLLQKDDLGTIREILAQQQRSREVVETDSQLEDLLLGESE